MAKIHPSAIVHPNAKLAEDVEIGPFMLSVNMLKSEPVPN